MKKRHMMLWTIFLALVLLPSTAFSWGPATHAYIDDHLGKKWGFENMNELYGGMAPDIFNYMFESPHLQDLYSATHYDFRKVWNVSRCGLEKSLAYGFGSHNGEWGVDSTAHKSSYTYGQYEGYVIAKAQELLAFIPLPDELAIPDEVALEIYHNIVECGVDILIKTKKNPMIGQKIIYSALLRSPSFPLLLVKAYAKDFSPYFGGYIEAAKVITSAEREFRKMMILYGYALMQDEQTAIRLISEEMADRAESFLGFYGIPVSLPKEQVIELIIGLITNSMSLCESDYSREIAETIYFVDQNLKAEGISY